MLTPLLQPIDAYTGLARLFNNYLSRLLQLAAVVTPRESMSEWIAVLNEQEEQAAALGTQLYHLQVLAQALSSLYQCVFRADLSLGSFLHEYDGDHQTYASEARAEHVEDEGSADPADFYPDGSVRNRTEPEALAAFTIRAELAAYFAEAPTQGEKIGSSGPADFAYFSNLMQNGLVVSLLDEAQSAFPHNLTTVRLAEVVAGGAAAEELPADWQHVDLDPTLPGAVLVAQLATVLELGQQARACYAALRDDEPASYRALYELLSRLLEGTT